MANIIVSACLLGLETRYKGDGCLCERLRELAGKHTLVPVCPEQLGGLPTPRPPCEILNGRVVDRSGADKTESYRQGAQAVLALARTYGATQALLQNRSPSCGIGWIYDGTFSKTLVPGDGFTARLLAENGIQVIGIE